jgi:hypothetical protein
VRAVVVSAPAVSENVSGRDQPGYRGDPLHHVVRFYSISGFNPGYRNGGLAARCEAGDLDAIIDGGHTGDELARYARQHAGIPDP